MKLKDILRNEIVQEQGTRTAPLNGIYGATQIFGERDFSKYSLSKAQIFRGIESGPAYGYVEPSKFSRRSAHTENYYTLVLDNSKRWSEYPKRSKSIVCSTGQGVPSNYGDIYLVVPEGDPKIGLAPRRDIWISFSSRLGPLGIQGLDEFNIVLSNLGKAIMGESPPEDSYSNFVEFLDEIEEVGSGEGFDEIITTSKMSYENTKYYVPNLAMFLKEFENQSRDLIGYIEYLLDPGENGFEIKEYSLFYSVSEDVEVWSNPALVVRKDKWDEFFQETIGMDTPFRN